LQPGDFNGIQTKGKFSCRAEAWSGARTYCGRRPCEIQVDHGIILLRQASGCSGRSRRGQRHR
jgi:hypothetical protein